MSVVSAVTATAAGLAAILSAVNLWISGRRELDRWTRQELVEALVKFLDTSFTLRSTCRELVFLDPAAKSEISKIKAAIASAHALETDTLTRLRLLAPSRVVIAAEDLHEADHGVIDSYFAESPQTEYRQALVRTRIARVQFINSARSAFRLRDSADIRHRHDGTQWQRFLDSLAVLPEEQAQDHVVSRPPSRGSPCTEG